MIMLLPVPRRIASVMRDVQKEKMKAVSLISILGLHDL